MELDNVFYINLSHRTDRKYNVERQMRQMGWKNYTRFEAIRHKCPAIGCYLSHIAVLERAKKLGLEYVVVLEDDVVFKDPVLYSKMFHRFREMGLKWDVLMMAGSFITVQSRVRDFVYKLQRAQAGTGYIVKKHYYDVLINRLKEGAELLLANVSDGSSYSKYALDVYWRPLQERDTWLIFLPRTVSQLPGYSDIERKPVNYDRYMIDFIRP